MNGLTKTLIISGIITIGLMAQPYRIAHVSGVSMLPTITPGSVCIVRVTKDVEPGDVIVYRCNLPNYPRYIIHRVNVIAKDGRMITQGDNNSLPDICIPGKTDIVGKVVKVYAEKER